MPDEMRQFLHHLASTLRPATVRGYRSTLNGFYDWLAKNKLVLHDLNRPSCLQWAEHLLDKGLHPASRLADLVRVRRYLGWLAERGMAKQDAYEFIQGRDLPKTPQYLPRPLTPDVDCALQKRLRTNGSTHALALYLMRKAGLRIGELRLLESRCIHMDHGGTSYLKVPLGKLLNERLVPLDQDTVEVVLELQRRTDARVPLLIPGPRGVPVAREKFQAVLRDIGAGLLPPHELTTHRLRHTFATSLLTAGLSLPTLMRLLGHRDIRMTLRYTQITDTTMNREYYHALTCISQRYQAFHPPNPSPRSTDFCPVTGIEDVIRWVRKNLHVNGTNEDVQLLVRRLKGASTELKRLIQLQNTDSP